MFSQEGDLMFSPINKDNAPIFVERLNQLINASPLAQKDIAKKIGTAGITQDSLCRYKNGRSRPSEQILTDMARFFRVSPEYLKGETDDQTPISHMISVWDEEITPGLSDELLIYDYFAEPSEKKQSEAFLCFLLSQGYSMKDIQDHAGDLEKLQSSIAESMKFPLSLMGLTPTVKQQPTVKKRKRVKKNENG